MRLTSSTHNHTNLCDGRNTPDEMARAALEAGFTDFGFSGHSYAPFDLDYSVKSEQHYVQELRALQKAYAGRLRIAVGMEADWFAPVNDRWTTSLALCITCGTKPQAGIMPWTAHRRLWTPV